VKRRHNILVVDFGGVGDLVLSIPFLRGLKRAFPTAAVSVLSAQRAGSILYDQLYIQRLYLTPISWRGLFVMGLRLRKRRFDMAINLMPETSYRAAIKMYLLFLLINARQWVGRNTAGRGFFYDIKVEEQNMQTEDEVLFYGKILAAIADIDYNTQLEFYISAKNKKKAEALLARVRHFKKDFLILVNPGSDWPAKRWPIEYYAAVVEKLQALFPKSEFGIIGSPSEVPLAHVIKERDGARVFVLSGATPLEILPAVIMRASLLITNDSGPAHIARAVGTPAVILAGPSAPAFFSIQGLKETYVIHHPVVCAPCLKISCSSLACWKQISVDEVVEAAAQLLRKKNK
jgi:ADP-heptose:LPS heptosyltransferase